MAFNAKNLSVLAYANGFTLWHYVSTDTAATIDTAGYFSPAHQMMRVGDLIMANVDIDGTRAAGMLHVSANAAGVVDVDNMTAISGTDSD